MSTLASAAIPVAETPSIADSSPSPRHASASSRSSGSSRDELRQAMRDLTWEYGSITEAARILAAEGRAPRDEILRLAAQTESPHGVLPVVDAAEALPDDERQDVRLMLVLLNHGVRSSSRPRLAALASRDRVLLSEHQYNAAVLASPDISETLREDLERDCRLIQVQRLHLSHEARLELERLGIREGMELVTLLGGGSPEWDQAVLSHAFPDILHAGRERGQLLDLDSLQNRSLQNALGYEATMAPEDRTETVESVESDRARLAEDIHEARRLRVEGLLDAAQAPVPEATPEANIPTADAPRKRRPARSR